jgi:membrane fusion protein (multidrug efflux system)
MLVGVIVVVGGLGYIKYTQIRAAMAMGAHFALPPAAVTTIVVHQASWQPTVRAIGSLEAVQGVTVSADLPGIVKDILFESGKPAKAGDVLVRLVTDEEQAQLASAEAQRDLKVVSLQRQKDLLKVKSAAQSDYDTADAEYRQAEAALAQAKAVIDRKTIRAPFDGQLGIRLVNIGQYLNSGDKVVPLQSVDPIYVNFTLPEQNMSTFGVNTGVQVRTDATGDSVFEGKITAINSQVDTATRNFQAQATVANPGGKLRSGMFANVDVLLADSSSVLPVPSSAISYAPYGNSVFVVTQLKDEHGKSYLGVSQHFVKLGQTRGDLVAVLSGLKAGDEVVSSGVYKLQNNAPVLINNTVQPGAEEAPNPEES